MTLQEANKIAQKRIAELEATVEQWEAYYIAERVDNMALREALQKVYDNAGDHNLIVDVVNGVL